MDQQTLKLVLDGLRAQPAETEVFEFKEAKNDFDSEKLGQYFSALSNEANLHEQPCAWLVFGIKDKGRAVVGTDYRIHRAHLDSLKGEIAKKTTNSITFMQIHELKLPEGRVVMFQIPAAPHGIPVAYDGHYYGRNGGELSALNIEEIERMRQAMQMDWSAGIVEGATIADLDPSAIVVARTNYKSKFPEKAAEVDTWDDAVFLNKAKITIKGKITRSAILLLGKEESEHFITPAEAKIRWVLKDVNNNEKDHEVFTCPFLLAVDKVYAKIRNLKYRYLKEGTLFPDEVLKYEPFVIREAINNCIAHQDYSRGGRINVVEIEDEQIIFSNYGDFIPGSVEKVISTDAPEEYYRNKFLVTAMFNLKMVDTIGSGIKKMFQFQSARFFPMPDYDFRDGKVKVSIIGKVLDIDFARLLVSNTDLSLQDIILLDKVQKKKAISKDEAAYLKKRGYIEGRRPNYFISATVASSTKSEKLKAQYIKHRALDNTHYRELIIKYLNQYKIATRKDINALLSDKLSDALSDKQKASKISNLLVSLRKGGAIKNSGSDKAPCWKLSSKR